MVAGGLHNMSISSRIPLPGSGNDAFKDVMDYFEQIQARKAQQQQAAAQLAQQSKYQQGELGLRQQELAQQKAYQGQLAALEAKRFADEHAKNLIETDPQAFAKLFSGLGNIQGQTPAQTSGSITPLQRMWMKKYMGISQTPEEKQQMDIQTAGGSETAKLQAKKNQDYLDAADVVNQYAPNIKTIHNLLEKDNYLTGNIAGLRNMAHLGNDDQGSFNAAALPLLGKLAKDISQRGGAVVARLATSGKPSLWNSPQTNKGLTDQLIQESINAYDQAKQNYEANTGKAYPKKLDSFLDGQRIVKVKTPNGNIINLPKSGAQKLIIEYPDHQIME